MRTLLLDKVNSGSHPDEIVYFEKTKQFHECQMEMSENKIIIYRNGLIAFETSLALYEHDHLTKTYLGTWPDGKRFRIVQPSDELRSLFQVMEKENITIGSMFSDGYAVTFQLSNSLQRSESKYKSDIIDATATFNSSNHQRFENGMPVRGLQYCNRTIEIKPNTEGCKGYNIAAGDGYIITVFNMDGNHPVWGNNVQMTPKPMRIIQQSNDKIVLRGYSCLAMGPFGWVDFDGSDYGLSIHIGDNAIIQCTLHMHDRKVDIEYYR